MTVISLRSAEWIRGLQLLCRAILRPGMRMAEIGCFAGEATEVFAAHVSDVFAIDPWLDSYRRDVVRGCTSRRLRAALLNDPIAPMAEVEAAFDARLAKSKSVWKLKGYDWEVIDGFPDGSLDFVYIDAIHTATELRRAIASWRLKLRRGGFLGGHDYSPAWAGVVRTVGELFGIPDRVYPDTSWVVRL